MRCGTLTLTLTNPTPNPNPGIAGNACGAGIGGADRQGHSSSGGGDGACFGTRDTFASGSGSARCSDVDGAVDLSRGMEAAADDDLTIID